MVKNEVVVSVSNEAVLVHNCVKIVGCDTGRIILTLDKIYFIAGYERNTKDNKEYFRQNNKTEKRDNFNYILEKVVASGKTEKELIDSCKEYKRFLRKDAIKKVLGELINMDNKEYNSVIEKHKNGKYAEILKNVGFFN